jgi:hypothetical protein
MMEVKLDEIMGCLHLACERQIKNREMTVEEFYDRIDEIPPHAVIFAAKQALVRAFPTMADQLGMGAGVSNAPFVPGVGETSTNSAPPQESTQEQQT